MLYRPHRRHGNIRADNKETEVVATEVVIRTEAGEHESIGALRIMQLSTGLIHRNTVTHTGHTIIRRQNATGRLPVTEILLT